MASDDEINFPDGWEHIGAAFDEDKYIVKVCRKTLLEWGHQNIKCQRYEKAIKGCINALFAQGKQFDPDKAGEYFSAILIVLEKLEQALEGERDE